MTNNKNPSSIFNISEEGFRELIKAGIDLNGLFVLDSIWRGADISNIHPRLEAWKQELIRKEYLVEGGKVLTLLGTILVNNMETGISFSSVKKFMKVSIEDDFDKWWKLYPSTDVFEYRGKKFEGTRGFRVKKSECCEKFKKILNEGELTAEDMIRALEYEILLKKEASVREGENKIKYMQNSLTYLNQRTFDNFVEISKVHKIETKSSNNNMDI